MSLLSVIIPNKNSPFLTKTIEDILEKSVEEIEILVMVDGNLPEVMVSDDRVKYIIPEHPLGMRTAINNGVNKAKGEFIMKTDDHCMFSWEFDRVLKDNHSQYNWIQIPRRYALDPIKWEREERTDNKYPIDYMFIDFPRKGKANDDGMHGVPWKEKRDERQGIILDDTPSMQGSCWFTTQKWFVEDLGYMSAVGYGQFAQEAQELGFKAWLGGGAVKVNKNAWYAHLHKGKTYGRMYSMPSGNVEADSWSADYWLNNRWEGRKYDFEWFIDQKFPNMPTWPADWKQQIKDMGWVK